MPSIIVSDRCPAPHFNLTEREVKECMPELENYLRVGHESEQVKDWFYRTQRTIIDEIEQDNQVPGI
jgi:hypothetical protein